VCVAIAKISMVFTILFDVETREDMEHLGMNHEGGPVVKLCYGSSKGVVC